MNMAGISASIWYQKVVWLMDYHTTQDLGTSESIWKVTSLNGNPQFISVHQTIFLKVIDAMFHILCVQMSLPFCQKASYVKYILTRVTFIL